MDEAREDARHKFFSEHSLGPDRRAYVQDFFVRRKAFLQLLKDEELQRVHEQEVRLSSIRADQAQRSKEFQERLKRGERPSAGLWPGSN